MSSELYPERSHLLRNNDDSNNVDLENPYKDPIPLRSIWYLIALTVSLLGVQLTWSVELGYGSPYLFSLGLRKEYTSIIWIAGPLTGIIIQPISGILSDRFQSKLGRRRPFMLGASLLGTFSLFLMGWAPDLSELLFKGTTANRVTIVLATLSIYLLDIAVNIVMASARSLIVDSVRSDQQHDANSWAGRMIGIGNVCGYLLGFLPLYRIFAFLNITQLQAFCTMASIFLVMTVGITSLIVKERSFPVSGSDQSVLSEILEFFGTMRQTISSLPDSLRKICYVQFFAYFGWFPFLFYITTYVGTLFLRHAPKGHEEDWDMATRQGSFALLLFAIVSLASNTALPLLLEHEGDDDDDDDDDDDETATEESSRAYERHLRPAEYIPRSSAEPSERSSLRSEPTEAPSPAPSASTSRLQRMMPSNHSIISTFSTKVQIKGLTLPNLWLFSHVLFGICMLSTFFLGTSWEAQVMVAICGLSWACTLWIPYSLFSSEVAKLGLRESSGKMIGVHNVFISAPQVLSTIIATIVFIHSEGSHRDINDNSVAWVLRIGGLAAFVAAFLCRKLLSFDF
ncbi:alpha-glucoside transporter Sut1 [Schizosaccharomyces cryophilus OY26]|uniref:Alpha-glucoside transporter Sut1 n=1 Tax=Schizosaccharomyces cryophilus (strain OY26 / ATCC MYA-4695 / CBS 11777 / NBRC 106824 / NRRL Y48691) TaxID=653667 RepID=S9VUN4_SCHCR|nr:alpha-glucoside transporter Sut1 [Schizosaccharomyces cryophilus OY26]EPY51503.1 alpha-glucoside transporter Sut1 [Schizosaccharomyces cryophilus OY26]